MVQSGQQHHSIWGFSVLSNLFASYKDSPDSTYLMYGAPLVLFGFVALYVGVSVFRSGRV